MGIMKHLFVTIFCSLLCLVSLNNLAAQSAIPSIDGWSREEHAGEVVFTPRTLIKSNFSYELKPLSAQTKTDLKQWIVAQATKELKMEGYSLPYLAHAEIEDIQTLVNWSVEAVKDNKHWMFDYMAFKQQDGRIRYARMRFPTAFNQEYLNTAVAHFASLTLGQQSRQPAGRPVEASEEKRSVAKATSSTTSGEPLTEPGMGLKESAIRGVVMKTSYGYGVGGMMIVEYRPYLLLKDGSIYKYLSYAPYDFSVDKSKSLEPDKWGKWRLDGQELVVTLPESTGLKTDRWKHKSWYWTRPAQPGEKINGRFNTISGGGSLAVGGSAMTVSASNIRFNDKGQFTFSRVAGGAGSGNGVSSSAYSSREEAGTYYLNGYSIELRFNNGVKKRFLFYFYPDSKKAFRMNESDYVSSDE